jgi:transcriptional regulator with XRE-family HTH domain
MKEKRHALDLSQARLAEKINTAPTYIAMIELEKKFPSVDMLEKIAAALEIDAPELFSVGAYRRIRLKNSTGKFLRILKRSLTSGLGNCKQRPNPRLRYQH